jgi:outer membrane protein assembly factor BamB
MSHPRWISLLMVLFLLCGPSSPLQAQSPRAKEILQQSPPRGIVVLLGVTDATLPIEVARGSELTLFVQVAGEKQAQTLRQAVAKEGLLGSRIYIDSGDLKTLHLASDIADAVFVTGTLKAEGLRPEILRILHPAGVGYLANEKLVKPFARDTDDWSHPYHGPDNNPQSLDKIAGAPYQTHFMAEPWYGAMPQMSVISGGRIFKLWGNRSSKQPQWPVLNTLMAMNAFNGTTLWTMPLKDGFMWHRNTLVATPDTLFLGDDTSCKLIDPATGKIRNEIIAPKDLSDGPVWSWMAVQDGVLYALVGKEEPKVEMVKTGVFRGAGWPWWQYPDYGFGFGRTILAIDPATRKVLWHHRENDYLDMRAMCMTKDRIFFYSDKKFLGCLDAKTGKVVWKSTDAKLLDAIGENAKAQFPLAGYSTSSYVKCSNDALFFAGPTRKNLLGVSAKDGKLLWQMEGGNSQLVQRDEGLYVLGEGRINEKVSSYLLEPLSGKVIARFPSRDRCTRATGCVDAIFTRGGKGGSTAVFQLEDDQPTVGLITPMRPACQDGVVVAHGHLFWGPWMCRCDSTQIGVISLGAGKGFNYGAEAKEEERLYVNRIKVIDKITFHEPTDWPTYRGQNTRLAYTPQNIPEKVKQRWVYSPVAANVPTAPVAAYDEVIVAGSDGIVRAMDTSTGKHKWEFYTGGAVKYPPVINGHRVYVGSCDGSIYCFSRYDGFPIWRFRAAPVERKIPIFGSLMSTWPVGSGVLVEDGVVYAAAGNANYDGTHVYALDAMTGKIRWQNNNSGHQIADASSGAGVQGHLLLYNKKIYMPGGNLTGVVSYDTGDGKFERVGNAVGKDLFVLRNNVYSSGVGLYWRPQDSHYIQAAGLETPAGLIAVYEDQVALADPASDIAKPKSIWSAKPFGENAAVAVGQNAVIVAGIDRDKDNQDLVTAGICAVSVKDGSILWRQSLPAAPVSWGVAVDRYGQILVALQDGKVVCLEVVK